MAMKRISVLEVHQRKVRELGLDPEAADLTSVEALAASLRRSAGFMCPCSATTLVRAVTEPLRGLVPELGAVRESLEEILEAIVGQGDLLEFNDIAADG